MPGCCSCRKETTMKRKSLLEVLVWVFSAAPLAATALLYPQLPDTIPIHWNMAGEIDGWAGKSQAFVLAGVCLAVSLLLRVVPLLDPKKDNYRKFSKGYAALRLACAVFFCLMQGITLFAAFQPKALPIDRLIVGGMGLLFCVMGNFMPKFKHNYFCGIRTPWTLASEETWWRTHRLAGLFWFWGGLAVAVLAVFCSGAVLTAATVAVLTVVGLVPVIYSWWLWQTGRAR